MDFLGTIGNKLMLTQSQISELKQAHRVVELAFNIDNLFLKTRAERYVVARSVFFSYCYNHKNLVYLILKEYSGFNHTTIINSVKNFESYKKYYPYKCEIDYFVSLISK